METKECRATLLCRLSDYVVCSSLSLSLSLSLTHSSSSFSSSADASSQSVPPPLPRLRLLSCAALSCRSTTISWGALLFLFLFLFLLFLSMASLPHYPCTQGKSRFSRNKEKNKNNTQKLFFVTLLRENSRESYSQILILILILRLILKMEPGHLANQLGRTRCIFSAIQFRLG